MTTLAEFKKMRDEDLNSPHRLGKFSVWVLLAIGVFSGILMISNFFTGVAQTFIVVICISSLASFFQKLGYHQGYVDCSMDMWGRHNSLDGAISYSLQNKKRVSKDAK